MKVGEGLKMFDNSAAYGSVVKKILGNGIVFEVLKYLYYRCQTIGSCKKWNNLLNASNSGIRLNLGSGAIKGNKLWTTVDLVGADINWDLKNGIPLPDNSVNEVYCSHLLEHIPYTGLIKFLLEINRVLKPGGLFKVAVPNARIYIESYVLKKPVSSEIILYQPAIVNTGSSMDYINYIAYMAGSHSYMFDEENLINTLKLGKFSIVDCRDFETDLDIQTRHAESIYAVCKK